MTTTNTGSTGTTKPTEQAELLATLAAHRAFLRFTLRELTTEQAAQRTTASELCLGGLVKHVASVEETWVRFIVEGASAMPDFDAMTEADWQRRVDDFRVLDGETLEGILQHYESVAYRTEAAVADVADLDVSHHLPKAPWFEEDSWSARRVLLHIIAETAQHAGHADIIRESLDGAKTMG